MPTLSKPDPSSATTGVFLWRRSFSMVVMSKKSLVRCS